MRINQFVAQATGMSRRSADKVVTDGKVLINDLVAKPGSRVESGDTVTLHNNKLELKPHTLIALHKPVGYVCSRDGQGSRTVYELLPEELGRLKPVGRLDKDSSGLLLLTDNGELANQLMHPSFGKKKIYHVELDKILTPKDKEKIQRGVTLEDGMSKLDLEGSGTAWTIKMSEGRNRQIRRTFSALGYNVMQLHRTTLGDYTLNDLATGEYKTLQ